MADPVWCPVLRPTRKEFERPFEEFVAEVFANDPNLPMFKVVPPAEWKARAGSFPPLQNVIINTPIRQNAFGTKGCFRCIFEEQREMTVEEFERIAAEEDMRSQAQIKKMDGDDAESLLERAFWSNVTLKPPMYGADTPVSFFDAQLPFGWNLRDLRDMLSNRDIPSIAGVTTPMTYFGMWRSFFGWHKEDADLLSINFLHFGAPKVWYGVSPKDQGRFERMAASIFPELYKSCRAFIRHKDILLSPQLLRANNIPFMQTKQERGEFVVLNAAAYHSGFNMGFNCAEAINFATPAWIDVGKAAVPCHCRSDAVKISMSLFDPSWVSDDDSGYDSEDIFRAGTKRRHRRRGPNGAKRSRLDMDGEVVIGKPCAIVGERHDGDKFFALVEHVQRPADNPECVVLRWLREGPDGLYRAVPTYWEERPEALISIRTQYLADGPRNAKVALGAGWKLLTLKSKILDTELMDG